MRILLLHVTTNEDYWGQTIDSQTSPYLKVELVDTNKSLPQPITKPICSFLSTSLMLALKFDFFITNDENIGAMEAPQKVRGYCTIRI